MDFSILTILGFYSLSGRTSYRKMSRSLGSRENRDKTCLITLKFDRHLGSRAVKCHSDTMVTTSNLAASRLGWSIAVHQERANTSAFRQRECKHQPQQHISVDKIKLCRNSTHAFWYLMLGCLAFTDLSVSIIGTDCLSCHDAAPVDG